jgi:hypothetical protein
MIIQSLSEPKKEIPQNKTGRVIQPLISPDKPILERKPVVTPQVVSTPSKIEQFGSSLKTAISPKSVLKGVANVGVTGLQLATSTIDFAADFLASSIEKQIREVPLVGISGLQKGNPKAADKWKEFYSKTGGAVTEKFKQLSNELGKNPALQPSEEWNKSSLQEKFTTRLPETVASIGPGVVSSLGAFAINPTLGFTVSSGSTADEIKSIAIENGVPQHKAELLGLGTGLLVGFLDKIVPDEVFSPQQKKKFVGSLIKNIVKTGLKESGTEMTQEGIQILVEDTLKKDFNFDDAKTRIAMSGLGGLLGGAGARSIIGYVNGIRDGSIAGIDPKEITPPEIKQESVKQAEEPIVEQVKPEPKISQKEFVEKVNEPLRKIYQEADQEKLMKAQMEIMTELEISEAGKRFMQPDGTWTGTPSTFPQWIPSELRSRKLFNSVMNGLSDIHNIKYPDITQPRKQALYDAILDEIDFRSGINSKEVRQLIFNQLNERRKNETFKTTVPGSSQRGEVTGKEKVVEEKPKEIEVPRSQIPVGEGKQKVSRLESRVAETIAKMTPEEIEAISPATYNVMSKKENINAASQYVVNNPDDALKVITGEIEAPKGILRNSVYVAMENFASEDINLARKLASIASTRMGQEISILTEINKDSPIRIMRELVQIREKSLQEKTGKSIEKAKKDEIETIKKEVKTPDKNDWGKFINSIQC